MTAAGPRRVVPVFLPSDADRGRLLDPPPRPPEGSLEEWRERQEAHIAGSLTRAAAGPGTQLGLFGGSIGALGDPSRAAVLALARSHAALPARAVLEPGDASPALLDELAAAGVATLEIDAGSFDDEALATCGLRWRTGEACAVIAEAAARFETGIILRPGMPGGSPAEVLRSARRAIELEPRFVRIYPVLVLAGTELARAFATRRYRPLSLDEAIETSRELLRLFDEAGIPVSRLGFQPATDLETKADVIAGPWHPSLRALAEAPAWRERASRLIAANFRFQKELTLVVSPRDESRLRGPQGANVRALREKFRLEKLVVRVDREADPGSLALELPDPESSAVRRIAG